MVWTASARYILIFHFSLLICLLFFFYYYYYFYIYIIIVRNSWGGRVCCVGARASLRFEKD